MVPAAPAADFVLVEADLRFRLLEAGLDGPAARRDLTEQQQRHPRWGIGQVQLELAAIEIASEYGGQLTPEGPGPEVADPLVSELIGAGPLGAEPDRERLPVLVRQPGRQVAERRRPPQVLAPPPAPALQGRRRGRAGHRADPRRRRRLEEIPEPVAVERVTEGRIATVDRIA